MGKSMSALTHALLALFTVKLLTGDSDTSNNEAAEGLLATAWGLWFLMLVSVGLIAFGIYSFFESFYRRVDTRVLGDDR